MAKRGRPAGATNKKKAPTSDGEERPNGGPPELTDDQRQALFFQHLKRVRTLKEKMASVNGELRAAYKVAKSELGSDAKAQLADALLLETDEGQAKMEAAIARQARIARWMAVPLGAQPDFFNTDMAPATDRAFDAGKAARLQGQPLKPPHDPSVEQYRAWSEGWHAGSDALAAADRRDDEMAFGEADAALSGPDAEETGDDDALAELVDAAEAE